MGLPVVTVLVDLGAGSLLATLVTHLMDISTFTPAFASMVGLGVGIDYVLFIVTRYREGLAAGYCVTGSLAQAVDTAGRAVFAAGMVVVIALLGLSTVSISFITALGIEAVIVVGLAVLVAVTLLPALLGIAGRRVNNLRVPGLRAAGERHHRNTMSYRFGCAMQKAPLLYALGAAMLLVLLRVPLLDIRLAFSDDGNKPTSLESRRAYDLLSEGFDPGFNGPFIVAVEERGGLDPGC